MAGSAGKRHLAHFTREIIYLVSQAYHSSIFQISKLRVVFDIGFRFVAVINVYKQHSVTCLPNFQNGVFYPEIVYLFMLLTQRLRLREKWI